MALTPEQFEQLKERLTTAKKELKSDDYSRLSSAISQSAESKGFFRSLYEGIAGPALNLIARPGQLAQRLAGQEPSSGRFAGVEITKPPEDIAGLKKDVGRGIQTAALAIPAGSIGRLAAGGGAFGLGASLEEGNPLFSSETALSTLLGAGAGAGIGIGTKAVGKAISKGAQMVKSPLAKGASNFLGYTSDTAPEAIKRAITNPKEFASAQKEVVRLGNPKVLSNLQSGVRKLRTDLTEMYKVGQQQIIDKSKDVAVGFGERETKLFGTLAERFGIDLPQNLQSFSAKELLELNAEVNSLYSKKFVREGAEGLIVRKGKDVLDAIMEKSFKDAGVKDFLKGYSTQKTVLDSMNELFNAYKTKSPKAVSQAYRNISSSFQEDKYAYFEALKAFEDTTGVNVLDQLRAIQLQPFIRKSGKFSFDEVFRLVLLPLTSPKLVGLEAKTLGRLVNGAQSTGEFIANLSGLIEKGQRAKLGTSVEGFVGNSFNEAMQTPRRGSIGFEDVSKEAKKMGSGNDFVGYPDANAGSNPFYPIEKTPKKVEVKKSSIPKSLDPLAQEARKYKSAEDRIVGEAIKKHLESNGIKVNPDNTVTLYHATSPENIAKINKEGIIKGGSTATGGMTGLDLKPSAFFGTDMKWTKDTWGASGKVIEVKVPVQDIRQPSQNIKEVYFEGGLKKGSDGIWRPLVKPRSTFYDKLLVKGRKL